MTERLEGNVYMKTNVYIVKCESYEKADEKINDLLNLMGGMGQFA